MLGAQKAAVATCFLLFLPSRAVAVEPVKYIGVYVQPMIVWLWIGLLVIGIGTVLAMIPGRRRRPTDATSAPVDVVDAGVVDMRADDLQPVVTA